MKRFLSLFLLTAATASAFAQLNGSGYYRVQNYFTDRYVAIVDNRGSVDEVNTTIDHGALRSLEGFDENVSWNPATIIYFEHKGGLKYNLAGQGTDVYTITGGYYMDIDDYGDYPNTYLASGSVSKGGASVTKYLADGYTEDQYGYGGYFLSMNSDSKPRQNWYIKPVNQTDGQYFGIKPTVTVGGDYYATMYAAFPFSLPSGMKAYVISRVVNGYAILKEVASPVPAATPVIIKCNGSTVASNKVTLVASAGSPTSGNQLKGVYFCNPVAESTTHRNVVTYNSSTMRVLGVADGKLSFVKSTASMKREGSTYFIPANTAYLPVDASEVATLKVVTEDEYTAGVQTIEAEVKPQRQGVYNLNGVRVADTVEGLPKGIYVVNGKKVVL